MKKRKALTGPSHISITNHAIICPLKNTKNIEDAMTTKELYLEEMRLSRKNNPNIWECVAQFSHVPKDLRNTCIIKHGLKSPRFTVMGTGDSAILLCYEDNQVYLNRGSGWFWFGRCDRLPSRYQIAAARAV